MATKIDKLRRRSMETMSNIPWTLDNSTLKECVYVNFMIPWWPNESLSLSAVWCREVSAKPWSSFQNWHLLLTSNFCFGLVGDQKEKHVVGVRSLFGLIWYIWTNLTRFFLWNGGQHFVILAKLFLWSMIFCDISQDLLCQNIALLCLTREELIQKQGRK